MDAQTLARDGVYQHWVSCARKRPFGSRKRAKDQANFIRKKFKREMGVYNCPHCGQWHLFTERGKR